jgi:alanine-glyoxylate transaminase / serine-glyoxylate transaminase / serine-pyruvate transaminase
MPGRPFLQIPGPALVPERVVRAMSQSLIDHRGPQFAELLKKVLNGLKSVFQTSTGEIVLNPGSGTGAWESCVVNTLSPGDRVLGCVNGHFSARFCDTASAHGIEVQRLEVPYGLGIPADLVEAQLRADTQKRLKAVLVLHN